ncbi:MAG: hypothetical protein ACLSCV_09485 [Acutalibacteraceae bacterium]
MKLIRELKEKQVYPLCLFRFGVVAGVADRVAIMYAGKIVEIGTAEEIFIRLATLIHGDIICITGVCG